MSLSEYREGVNCFSSRGVHRLFILNIHILKFLGDISDDPSFPKNAVRGS